jgi:hypothetical protein
MTPPDERDAGRAHQDLLESLSRLLMSWHWQVDREPRVGALRPDLIAQGPDGQTYLFEVKAGRSQGHLGAIGQVEAFRNAFRAQEGREPVAVLLLAGDSPRELQQVAEDVGVTVLDGFQDDESAMADLLTAALPGADETASGSLS